MSGNIIIAISDELIADWEARSEQMEVDMDFLRARKRRLDDEINAAKFLQGKLLEEQNSEPDPTSMAFPLPDEEPCP